MYCQIIYKFNKKPLKNYFSGRTLFLPEKFLVDNSFFIKLFT
jgi:hypothetical protein